MTSLKIVASGSIDGILSTAAALRFFEAADVIFTQAFNLKLVDLGVAPTRLLLMGLDVDHHDPQSSADWLKRMAAQGHQLIGIADEHRGDVWKEFVIEAGFDFDSLIVKPKSRSEVSSAGMVLRNAVSLDDWASELCDLSAGSDQGQFSGVAEIVNEIVKADIRNDAKREYLARLLSQGEEQFLADQKVQEWLSAVQESKDQLKELVESAQWNKSIAIVDAGDYGNITGVMMSLYEKGAQFAVVRGLARDESKGGMIPVVSVGVPRGSVDITQYLRDQGVNVPIGFEMKATFAPEDEARVLDLLSAMIDLYGI